MDPPGRLDHERKLTRNLQRLWRLAEREVKQTGRLRVQAITRAFERLVRDEQEAAAVAILLLLTDIPVAQARRTAQTAVAPLARQAAQSLSQQLAGRAMSGEPIGQILTPDRAARTAATAITAAASAVEIEARAAQTAPDQPAPKRDQFGRIPLAQIRDGQIAIWQTERDSRVCKICAPLHGQDQDVWQDEFPFGPPAHPNCRCFLNYRGGGADDRAAPDQPSGDDVTLDDGVDASDLDLGSIAMPGTGQERKLTYEINRKRKGTPDEAIEVTVRTEGSPLIASSVTAVVTPQNELRITGATGQIIGRGLARKAYSVLALHGRQRGFAALRSDRSVSGSAARVWDSLERRAGNVTRAAQTTQDAAGQITSAQAGESVFRLDLKAVSPANLQASAEAQARQIR